MTKLKLNLAHQAGEILTREELKKIVGGTEGSGSGSCTCNGYASGEEQAHSLICAGTCPNVSFGNGSNYQQECRKALDYGPDGTGSPVYKVIGAHCYCA